MSSSAGDGAGQHNELTWLVNVCRQQGGTVEIQTEHTFMFLSHQSEKCDNNQVLVLSWSIYILIYSIHVV